MERLARARAPLPSATRLGEEESTAEDSHRAKAQQVQGRTAEARKAEGSHNEATCVCVCV